MFNQCETPVNMEDVEDQIWSPRRTWEYTDEEATLFDDGETAPGRWRRVSWKEAFERAEAERVRLAELASLLGELDRCEHGRHEGDPCSSCRGPSHGNPLLPEDRQIGFTIDGAQIRVPARGLVHEARNWVDPSGWRPRWNEG